jgi:hypothetical protein
MKNDENIEKRSCKNPKIEEKNGLNVRYDKKELERYFPHLIKEISNKEKAIKIDSIDFETQQYVEETGNNKVFPNSDELTNPGALEFLRRCTNKEEAIEILDYLLKRRELSQSEYDRYKYQIEQEDGLKKLIDGYGGFKPTGYYERKFRSKILKNKK